MEALPTGGNAIPFIDKIVSRLIAAFDPERVVLFGSWARGDARADSDIDILVIAESDEPIHRRMAAAHRALRGIAVSLDVFVCTPEEIERFRTWSSHTIAIALREGRTLHAA